MIKIRIEQTGTSSQPEYREVFHHVSNRANTPEDGLKDFFKEFLGTIVTGPATEADCASNKHGEFQITESTTTTATAKTRYATWEATVDLN